MFSIKGSGNIQARIYEEANENGIVRFEFFISFFPCISIVIYSLPRKIPEWASLRRQPDFLWIRRCPEHVGPAMLFDCKLHTDSPHDPEFRFPLLEKKLAFHCNSSQRRIALLL